MQARLVLGAVACAIACHSEMPRAPAVPSLAQLDAAGDVFALRDRLATSPASDDLAFYRAVVAYAFNQPVESRRAASAFLTAAAPGDPRAPRARALIEAALVREGRYADAAAAMEDLLAHHAAALDAAKLDDDRNELALWRALAGAPAQTVRATAASHIPMHRDRVGLLRVPAAVGPVTTELVVDTGANLSVLSRSLAERAGLTILDAHIAVAALTGTKVSADLAVLPELVLGNHRVRDVVVLVFDDAALSFPDAHYAIEGIIGFPVLEALGELRLHGDRELELPAAHTARTAGNLALSELKLLVQIHRGGDALIATLDTGATHATLFAPWFERYRAEIAAAGYPRHDIAQGGAGGMRSNAGYVIPRVALQIAGRDVTLRDVTLLPGLGADGGAIVANLGQDMLRQFDTVVLDLRSMALELLPPARSPG